MSWVATTVARSSSRASKGHWKQTPASRLCTWLATRPKSKKRGGLDDRRVEVVHASEVLTMDDKPLEGIRRKKDSSMVRAIELVREGKADAVISPGNTGALVAGSMKLRRLEGIERPALAARMPSR